MELPYPHLRRPVRGWGTWMAPNNLWYKKHGDTTSHWSNGSDGSNACSHSYNAEPGDSGTVMDCLCVLVEGEDAEDNSQGSNSSPLKASLVRFLHVTIWFVAWEADHEGWWGPHIEVEHPHRDVGQMRTSSNSLVGRGSWRANTSVYA